MYISHTSLCAHSALTLLVELLTPSIHCSPTEIDAILLRMKAEFGKDASMLVIDDMAPGLVIHQFIPVDHCFVVVTCVNQINDGLWSGEHLQAFDSEDCEMLIKGRVDQDVCKALRLDPIQINLIINRAQKDLNMN
jgi:hypothetical protein